VIGFLVSGHYRQPIAFGPGALEQSAARNERLREFFRDGSDPPGSPAPAVLARREEFLAALADDFNTPRALAELFQLLAEARREPLPGARTVLAELLGLLGLESVAAGPDSEAGPDDQAADLLAERERARAERDFGRADEIRDRLAELGYEVRDTAGGVRLVRRGG
jgi:cysteinyl-tRNA synthetase